MGSENITLCCCNSRAFVEKNKVLAVASSLRSKGYRVNLVDDLCRMVADEPEKMKEIAQGTIMACHPRAVISHLNQLGIVAGKIIDIRNNKAEDILASYNITDEEGAISEVHEKTLRELEALPVFEGSDAWYPVIDKTLCTNCGKCHDFCLFGVYTVENQQVLVSQPHLCKNNCPACARMCPSRAIIFPKYEKSPINGGTEMEEEFTEEDKEAMYQKRLQYRLQQNRNRFSMLKKTNK